MSTNTKPAAEMVLSRNGPMADHSDSPAADKSTAPRQKTVEIEPKASLRSKTNKAARRSPQSSATASKPEKLVCRYCGSDDLAPSFKKRRDARCRACFKKRYGSPVRGKQAARGRKAKATK